MVASLEKSFGQEGEGKSWDTVLQLKTLLCGDYKYFNSIFNINIDNYKALVTIQCPNINVVNYHMSSGTIKHDDAISAKYS